MVKVQVANLKREEIRIKPIKEIVERVLREEGVDGVEVSLVLADDEFIQELNQVWRGVDSPTDVLAFPFREEGGGMREGDCLGEIVISVDAARRQAKDYGHNLERELKILSVHGALHLLGYDHEREQDASKMQEREREFCQR